MAHGRIESQYCAARSVEECPPVDFERALVTHPFSLS
jgi:hypothetical protein